MYWVVIFLKKKPKQDIVNHGIITTKITSFIKASSFTVCTFWFIRCLIKIGDHKKAKKYFEQLLSYSNHLGLFSEDLDFESKRMLGNFPQAYSHLALIDVALEFNALKEYL